MTEEQAKKIEVRRIRIDAIKRCMDLFLRRLMECEAWDATDWALFEHTAREVERDLIPYLYGEEY